MRNHILRRRLSKFFTSILHPVCWRALSQGVAPVIEHLPLLRQLDADGIIDVGANRGQFSLACKMVLPNVPIIAFEPIPVEADLFERIHRAHGIRLFRCALGASPSTATLHLSKSKDSSSLLPIGKRQLQAYPGTDEAGTISVDVRTLDSFLPDIDGRTRQLLKIDVQGYELQVLRGAKEMLKLCRYVYAECSEVSLYDGQALRPEVSDFLSVFGFREVLSHNQSYNNGELIQADYLFARDEEQRPGGGESMTSGRT